MQSIPESVRDEIKEIERFAENKPNQNVVINQVKEIQKTGMK